MNMKDRLDKILTDGMERINAAISQAALQDVKAYLLGKQGQITAVLSEIPKLEPSMRGEVGRAANEIKNKLTQMIETRREEIALKASEIPRDFDLSLPGIMPQVGALHPITRMCYDLNDTFRSMGFEIFEESDITSELYAFDNLNFPPDHPARESMDTYWLVPGAGAAGSVCGVGVAGSACDAGAAGGAGAATAGAKLRGGDRLCLRPHLTGASVRYLQQVSQGENRREPPYRFVYPGRVYRNESTDAGHDRAFYQYEALIVDRDFTFASGKVMIGAILSKVFGREVPVRMRIGFFPFVEPGFEIDMQCLVCKGSGCSVCKNVGWIEIMPGGTPHPNVLRAGGLDPAEFTGFYVNIGLDRLVMMRYGIDDVRLFRSADLRFFRQFR